MEPQRQLVLFDLSPWKPPKKKRRRPEDLLALITDMHQRSKFGCRPGVQWFAREMGVCVRTIQRWLRKLSGKIVQILRGYHRSAVYKPLPSTCQVPLPPRKVSPQSVASGSTGPYVPTPGGSIRTKSAQPATAGASLTKRLCEKLQKAARRITGAKNPYAYRQAVLKHERELESADEWYAAEAKKKSVQRVEPSIAAEFLRYGAVKTL